MPGTAGYNEVVLIGAQTAFLTPKDPTAADAVRLVSADLGMTEQREIRVAKDKTPGRDESSIAFVEGRIPPIEWSLQGTLYAPDSAGAVPQGLAALFVNACGFTEAITGGTRVDYTPTALPSLLGCTIFRADRDETLAEQLWGALCGEYAEFFGDGEWRWEARGMAAGKSTIGQSTVAAMLVGDLTLTLQTIDHAKRFVGGSASTPAGADFYVKIDSEAIKVTAVNYATGVFTIVRAQLATAAAAHSAGATIKPYVPTATFQAASPISEADGSLSIDNGVSTFDGLTGSFKIMTGVVPRTPEYSKLRMQAGVANRFSCESSVSLILDVADQEMLGRANQKTAIDLLIKGGAGAGGKRRKMRLPFSLLVGPKPDWPDKDLVTAALAFKHRGSAGNDMFTLTYE